MKIKNYKGILLSTGLILVSLFQIYIFGYNIFLLSYIAANLINIWIMYIWQQKTNKSKIISIENLVKLILPYINNNGIKLIKSSYTIFIGIFGMIISPIVILINNFFSFSKLKGDGMNLIEIILLVIGITYIMFYTTFIFTNMLVNLNNKSHEE